MAYIKNLFDKNFIEYASYVIRDRAIPDIEDGLKPVQRRIMHTLFEVDDGRFNKVANVVGQCMKYHPHGDASIGGALVVLANKELFIDKQGNFGNLYTGDGASAARYIECRLKPMAKHVLYNPAITKYVPSYDGRNKEPVVFRAKLPVVLITGSEGIAVGMSTNILSHNVKEVIQAEIACLKGEKFQLYPDCFTGGLIDVSDYQDGLGKITTRAKLDTSDPKRIVITELPFGSNSEQLTESIVKAAKSGKLKVSSVTDYTAEKVEIEIKLQRGVYAQDVVSALYAFTDCEQSISCNLLVIKDNMPQVMTVSDVIRYHSKKLVGILKDELELEKSQLIDKLHLRTLERIFIEERLYKRIEEEKTEAAVNKAVITGFEPFKAELIRPVTLDDVAHLLKIPIRRISLYDINKNRQEVIAINKRLKEIEKLLKNLVGYAVSWLEGTLETLESQFTKRRTQIKKFSAVDVKEVVKRDMPLRYDDKTGYLGTAISGGVEICRVTPFDRILFIRKSGIYTVCNVPEKLFVDSGMWYCGFAEKEEISKVLFTIIYRDVKTQYAYIKRCRIEQYIMNKDYLIVPDGMEVLHISTAKDFAFKLHYVPKPRAKVLEEVFKASSYEEKGLKAQGVRLATKEVASLELTKPRAVVGSSSASKKQTKE
ncbi:MAG: DNA topoisomerase IV subunit A [Spirochaetaceae bacterium]|nr:DNA topoisomerase IV subunit A [Spirochaetaceae bacterium]